MTDAAASESRSNSTTPTPSAKPMPSRRRQTTCTARRADTPLTGELDEAADGDATPSRPRPTPASIRRRAGPGTPDASPPARTSTRYRLSPPDPPSQTYRQPDPTRRCRCYRSSDSPHNPGSAHRPTVIRRDDPANTPVRLPFKSAAQSRRLRTPPMRPPATTAAGDPSPTPPAD